MDILRSTMVEAAFRPEDEEPRSLLDFVDEQGVEGMRDAVKESIRDAKVRTSFCFQIMTNGPIGSSNILRYVHTCLRRRYPSASRFYEILP